MRESNFMKIWLKRWWPGHVWGKGIDLRDAVLISYNSVALVHILSDNGHSIKAARALSHRNKWSHIRWGLPKGICWGPLELRGDPVLNNFSGINLLGLLFKCHEQQNCSDSSNHSWYRLWSGKESHWVTTKQTSKGKEGKMRPLLWTNCFSFKYVYT